MKQLKDLKTVLREFVEKTVDNNNKQLGLYVVTGINYDNTVNIKEITSNKSYSFIEVVSGALGNGKGIYYIPNINDLVLVGFLGGDVNRPIIIGSMFDTFSQNPDSKPPLSKDELFLSNKVNGSYIYLKSDGSIVVKNGAGKYTFNTDGSFSLPNYSLPSDKGSSGQVLKSDGLGGTYWGTDNT